MTAKLRRAFDWFFRDRAGRIVIGQWPNLPLWLFGAAAIVAAVAAGTPAGLYADLASRVFLFWWAGDEVLRGVNPWRRCLGAAVLLLLLVRLGA